MRARGGRGFRRRRKIAFLVGFGAPVMPRGSISMRGDQNWKQNSKSRWYSRERAKRSFPYLKMCHFWWTPKSGVFSRDIVQIYNKKMHQNVVKNVQRQVLELLSANGPLKKSLPITRQVRFEGLQNLEIWLLFQGLAATHNAICDWWVEFFIAVRFVKNLRQKFQPLKWSIYCRILRFWDALFW